MIGIDPKNGGYLATHSRYHALPRREAQACAWGDEKAIAGRRVVNRSLPEPVILSKPGLRHALLGSNRNRVDDELVRHLPELIGTALLVGSAPDKNGRNTVKAVHVLTAAAIVDGVPHLLRMIVRQTTKGSYSYDSHAVKVDPDVA